ncbi:unnamed protein product [Darwinula stevensoni]|uniref:Fibronectin type-III domain-containing protein n=1 Tax=Darwinula stevensoni TaxID=69355 RepID=A0A7R9FRJ7_9CRUS|nr:unnamed protein product [Darwinula stevensoni]CAG0901121.1 unnamed protein product [Darwinula stevensoni]
MIIRVQDLPLAPVNLEVSEVTASSLRLDWSYPTSSSMSPSFEPNHAVKEYEVKFHLTHESGVFEISGITEQYYTVQHLNYSTEYVFSVRAANFIGKGPWTPWTTATTRGPRTSLVMNFGRKAGQAN